MIVSVTTTEKRHLKIGRTLDSLVKQTLKPTAIVLNIGFDSKHLNVFCENNGIIINRTEDIGPITKLAPAIPFAQEKNASIIVTVDDDIVYPPTTLQELFAAYTKVKQPVSFSGYDLVTYNGGLAILQQRKPFTSVQVIEGYAGALYPVECFKEDFSSYVEKAIAHPCCKFHDDVVISAYLASKGWHPTYVEGTTVNRHVMLQNVLPHGKLEDALHLRENVIEKTVKAYRVLNIQPKNYK